jgi:hypothetical protein
MRGMTSRSWRSVAVGALALGAGAIASVACGGGPAGASCGKGTHLSGNTCIVDSDAGRDATGVPSPDAGRATDAGAHRDATNDVTSRPTDATSGGHDGAPRDGGGPDVLDARVGIDASETGTPVSCADTNSCVEPTNMGQVDMCDEQSVNATGDQSTWLTVDAVQCGGAVGQVILTSDPGAPFDVYVYQGDAGVPQSPLCPPLFGSSLCTTPDCCTGPIAALSIQDVGPLYIHVVAEADAGCSTGRPWSLIVGE